ncbi:hypothetical protein RvY_00027 [Ramazzottius varieornatus]|uniref:Uncharacterized protein n=1 Tax=Ramazzottius varieornatus TaxID=947166 RepID=A0A1D1UC76_RAMVA|nr:hypothetical protein RvY_00027 [Ramazzottius varieornatus]
MENSTSSSPSISKKTGALVFFVGCAIGLVISEILVGVASQKASQEAHKASVEYIQQVRKGGNGSVDKHHPSLKSPSNPKTPPGPGAKHLATLQSTVLVSRADNNRRSTEELEWEKTHKIQETHRRKMKKSKGHEKDKPHPRRNVHKRHQKHLQTVNVIRIRAEGDGRIVTRICRPDDKNCASE